jgi:hypothetical protein
MKGVLLGWFVGACRANMRDFCSALAVFLVRNMFFLNVHYFNSFVPIAQKSGQAVMLSRLSLSLCLVKSEEPLKNHLRLLFRPGSKHTTIAQKFI